MMGGTPPAWCPKAHFVQFAGAISTEVPRGRRIISQASSPANEYAPTEDTRSASTDWGGIANTLPYGCLAIRSLGRICRMVVVVAVRSTGVRHRRRAERRIDSRLRGNTTRERRGQSLLGIRGSPVTRRGSPMTPECGRETGRASMDAGTGDGGGTRVPGHRRWCGFGIPHPGAMPPSVMPSGGWGITDPPFASHVLDCKSARTEWANHVGFYVPGNPPRQP